MKRTTEIICNIFDIKRVFLWPNLSEKYPDGISSKKEAKKPIAVNTHNCWAVVSGRLKKYIDSIGMKFLLCDSKYIKNFDSSELSFSSMEDQF